MTRALQRGMSFLPFFAEGEVTKGLGRGSSSLGIPTANFNNQVVASIPDAMQSGVYYGFANIDQGPVYQMVMSVGRNPHFKNEVKTMETHILKRFPADFYGSWMRVCVVGFIRAMQSYSSIDELISAIHSDIDIAREQLNEPEMAKYASDGFFLGHDDDSAKNTSSSDPHLTLMKKQVCGEMMSKESQALLSSLAHTNSNGHSNGQL